MISFLRVLAVAPSTYGFGFAVIEEPNLLIDWGVKTVRKDKNARCVNLVGKLLDYYKPDVFILEDYKAKTSRRRSRIQALLKELSRLGATKKIQTRSISRAAIKKAFSSPGARNKQQIAMTIASQFTELALLLPQKRKPWMSEDYRMGIFDAVALALTYFNSVEREKDG